jgi:phosphoglycolate phosphatase-like HAD superfamily hydrolase
MAGMTPAHVIWDWNGTLLDDAWLVVEATNHAFRSCAGPLVGLEQYRSAFRRPIRDCYATLLGRPLPEAEFAELDRLFHDHYRRELGRAGLPADAYAALDLVLDKGWSQSMLSMWFHDELRSFVDRIGLAGRFVSVAGNPDRIGGARKAPALRRHLESLGRPASRCVVIGDVVDDAAAARAVGAHCVLYSGGYSDAAGLRATGLVVTDTLVAAVESAAGVLTDAALRPVED